MSSMVLYHGTNQIIRDIDLSKGRLRTDFGKGFYMGSNLGVAREWAKSHAMFSGTAIVMRYNLDVSVFNDNNINSCKFDFPTVEWLNFVRDNRRRLGKGVKTSEPRHKFGIVSGAIANDKVNFIVVDYMNGLITAEEAIKKVKVIPSVFQVSIHTSEALVYLNVDDSKYQKLLGNGSWSEWRSL